MSLQDQINALTSRLDNVAANVKTIEQNAATQPEADLTGLTSEITALEAVVNAGLPAPAAPTDGSTPTTPPSA